MTTKSVVPKSAEEIAKTPEQQFSAALSVTPEYIEKTTRSLALLKQLVNEVLVENRDYGSVPGVPEEFLWEPGADQIIASFNCRAGPARILSQIDDGTRIAIVLEIPLVSFQTGLEVACCVGASSTYETKHKYRWVKKDDLADWGYTTEESIATLKTKRDKWGGVKYRINNPEHAELLNTIWKIARKRAKSGAAQSLPGVSSALREKFAKKGKGGEGKPTSDWDVFWAKMSQMGLEYKQVHELLGVKSMKDWVQSGKTLEDAVTALAHKMPGPKDDLKASPAPVTDSGINIDWLKESIEQLAWKVDGKLVSQWLSDEYHIEGKTVSDILAKMTREQKEAFVKKVQSELNKASQKKR